LTTASPWNTGRSTMRLTPMMATSGWLITGVVTMPPSGPRLLMVMVEPASSSRPALPLRAASARRAISFAQVHRSIASAWRSTGTISPASVCAATPRCTASWRVTTPASSSKRAFIIGKSATASTTARAMKGSTVSLPRAVPCFAFSLARNASSSVTSISST
jgi:hypothetical protein